MGDSPAEMPVLLTIIILQTILELVGLFLFFRRSHLFPIRGRLPKLVGLTCGCFMAFSWLSLWQRLWPSQYPCILNLLQAHTIWLTAFNSILLRIWVLHFAYNATSAMTSLKSHSRDLRTLSMGNWYLLNKHRISPMYMARVTAILMTIELITPAVCLGVYPQMFSSMADGDCPTFASNVGAVLLTVAFCVLMYGFGRSLKKFHNDGFNIRRELQNVGWSGFVFVPGWLIVQYTPGIKGWNDNTFGLSTVVIMTGAFMVHVVSVFYPLFLSYQLEVSMATLSMDVEEMRSLDKFLQSPQGVADFQKFLATEFSVENLLFFLEIEAFRNAYKGNQIAPPPESKSPISSPRGMSFSNERAGATRQNTLNTMTQPISEEPPSQSGSGDDFTSGDVLGTRGVMASPSFSQAPLVPTVSMSISQNSQAGGPSSPLPRTRSVSSNAYRQSFNQDLPTTPQPSVAAAPSTNRTRTTTSSQYAVNVTFSNDVSIEEAARSIYYRYIRDHAPMQVNLPWHIRAALDFLELSEEVTETNSPRTDGDVPLSARRNPDIADRVGPFMFDEVQRSIFRLMETDSWLRYRKTESYHHLLQELRDKAATARLIMAVEK